MLFYYGRERGWTVRKLNQNYNYFVFVLIYVKYNVKNMSSSYIELVLD